MEPMEIGDICAHLEKFANSGVFGREEHDAFVQASSLLRQVRELACTGLTDDSLAKKIRELVAKQGDG